ncbi:MAG: endonuclease/exonuclease/phosphatase family protein, partial [Raoultibacter sp.]
MRCVSWNVNGLRAVAKKGFTDIFDAFDADIVALQETKLQEGQIELDLPGYHDFWSYAQRKGYSGTAVFSREEPLQTIHEVGVAELDLEGRVCALEFPTFWFV